MIQLRDYQERISTSAATLLREKKICYLSMECRTGKSLTALAAADKLGVKSVLFITKIKAKKSVEDDYRALNPNYELEVINYESVHKCVGKYDLVVCDEAHSLGAYPKPSQRAKAVKKVAKGKPVLYLSGTPSPESYSQLYHQFWICDYSPFAAYTTFYKWANTFVNKRQRMVNGYLINDYSAADKRKIDEITAGIFVSFSQEDAGFSTNIIEHTLIVPMKKETASYFRQLQKDRVISLNGRAVLGDTPAKLLSKLHQLSSGTVIAEDGTHQILDTSKAEYIRRMFAGKKVAIFYTYQSEFDLLKNAFPNWTESPEEFQASTDKVFISQVRKAREGVRLDSADALIFFSFEFSYLSYEQGRNRLVSKERKDAAEVYFLCGDFGIETEILSAVHGKQDFTLSYYGKALKNRQR